MGHWYPNSHTLSIRRCTAQGVTRKGEPWNHPRLIRKSESGTFKRTEIYWREYGPVHGTRIVRIWANNNFDSKLCKSGTLVVPIRILQMGILLINLVHTACDLAFFSSSTCPSHRWRTEDKTASVSNGYRIGAHFDTSASQWRAHLGTHYKLPK